MLDTLLVHQEDQPRSAAINMALDQAMLECSEVPRLRLYRWALPAITFGYFGALADTNQYLSTHDIVRRWTGGGMVFHGDDLTYALVLPSKVVPRQLATARAVYAAVHNAIRRALGDAVAVQVAPRTGENRAVACFQSPVENDLMAGERKIAGAAQRRTRSGLLQQGSIQGVPLPQEFPERFALALCPAAEWQPLPAGLLRRAEALAAARYATPEWLRLR